MGDQGSGEDQSEAPRELRLDLDRLKLIAARGVHRAAVFMGIAANVAQLSPPVSHVLDDKFKIVLVPEDVSDETKRHFLREFEKSVVANGLRELVDTFGVFATQVHSVAKFAHLAVRGVEPEEASAPNREFELENVANQLMRLEGILEGDFTLGPMFRSLVIARNILTHNRGIVRQRDSQTAGTFTMTWRSPFLWVETVDGKVLAEFEPGTDKGIGLSLDQETTIKAQFRDVAKTFAVGSSIELDRHELAQICQAVLSGADEVVASLIAYLGRLGIPHVATPQDLEATDVQGVGEDDRAKRASYSHESRRRRTP